MTIAIDYSDVGTGAPVILVHSSASGNRQWRSLAETLKDRHRVVAVNLFGYGTTAPWPPDRKQTLADQAELVVAAAKVVSDPVVLIGHSLGGAVSLQAALRLDGRARALVAFEPILFYMLGQHGPAAAFAEINDLATEYQARARRHDWQGAGALFVDYWSGCGTWAALPAERKAGLMKMLPNVVHEWDAVISPGPSLTDLKAISAPVHLVRAVDTRRPTYAIASMLASAQKSWRLHELAAGGHMAPVTRPDLFNPLAVQLLEGPFS